MSDRIETLIGEAGFEDLLEERAVDLGLISPGDAGRIHERHVLDSLRAAALVRPGDRTACDLGSGGGLPGLVVAIAVPHLTVTLAEVRARRAGFLELAVERLGLPSVRVHLGRAEDLPGPFDLCLARAFRSAPETWAIARPLLAPAGRLIYFAGEGEPPEIAGARVELAPTPFTSGGPLAIITAS
ncbi:MAG: 16S rRNA (guanine(527)-N(7))-methyltransferase RsmG [Actinomycetota bacterium]